MMMNLTVAVLAYLMGSLSFAVIVSRIMGLSDPRSYGSGNPGATNVLRSGSKKAALLTLLGDAFKGWLAVWLAGFCAGHAGLGLSVPTALAIAAAAVFLGHLFPIFFRFQGGKGVATAAGVLLGIDPWLGLAVLATWLIVAFFFRYSSLAALAAAVFAPFYDVFMFGPNRVAVSITVMSLLLIVRHRKNIANLLAGREGRIGEKKVSRESC